MAAAAYLQPHGNGVALALHVQPGARRTTVVGPHGDRLRVQVASPPTDDRANAELRRYLGRVFGVPRAQVELAAGAHTRQKRVLLHGVSPVAAAQALAREQQP